MTVICGIEHDGQVWLAADSSVTGAGTTRACREPKVRAVAGIVMGTGGGSREGDIAIAWQRPPRYTEGDPWRWVVCEFVPSLRQLMADAGLDDPDLAMLLGVGGRLFEMDSHGSAYSFPDGCAAIGTKTGAGAALAILKRGGWRTPNRRLTAALEAAASLCPFVLPPWRTVHG
jgi:ATP-dependent protease HslVU (ClpYQ) peptidase subunit